MGYAEVMLLWGAMTICPMISGNHCTQGVEGTPTMSTYQECMVRTQGKVNIAISVLNSQYPGLPWSTKHRCTSIPPEKEVEGEDA
jgi:hypothetical protein